MKKILYLDFETRSGLDLATCGTYRYAQHESTQMLLIAYAFDDEPVRVSRDLPDEVFAAIQSSEVLKIAHNAEFDHAIAEFVLGCPSGFDMWHDTAYQAAYFGWPRKLSALADALHTHRKASTEEMYFFTQPVRVPKRKDLVVWNEMENFPAEAARFESYAATDVAVMRECYKKMLALPEFECKIMRLTFEMNRNGVPFDIEFARQVQSLADGYAERAGKIASDKYRVENLRSTKQVMEALQREGVRLASLNKKERGDIQHELLELRDEATGSAFAKIKTAQTRICADGRLHGEFVGYGAHTGRWSSRGVQLQNFARIADEVSTDLSRVKSYDHLRQHMRLCIYAPSGYRFVCADLSQIEARITAWMANCKWRMQAFAAGEDIYSRSAERMFGLEHVDKSSPYRVTGKCAELGLGFGGGAGALQRVAPKFCAENGAEKVQETVQRWRSANPEICQLWYAIGDAFLRCQRSGVYPLIVAQGTKIVFRHGGSTTCIQLPSGRFLYYRNVNTQSADDMFYTDYSRGGGPVMTKLWHGVLVENIVQGIARDVLAEIMRSIAGSHPEMQLIGTVHDELWYLVRAEDTGALDVLLRAMSAPVSWAAGLLTKGDGFIDSRYMK